MAPVWRRTLGDGAAANVLAARDLGLHAHLHRSDGGTLAAIEAFTGG